MTETGDEATEVFQIGDYPPETAQKLIELCKGLDTRRWCAEAFDSE